MEENQSSFIKLNKPAFRKLRAYAFDPSLSLATDTVQVNNLVYKVEWEDLVKRAGSQQETLPAGEYIEIIDFDPASGLFYPLVDLNERALLAQDGLNPSVSNPQFHQQMVYAVVMTTIKNFELALGRKIQWSEHLYIDPVTKKTKSEFVERLRIYPHGLRQANAYYNPIKKSLIFGYFFAQSANPRLQQQGSVVFCCLSHDIIAHETTHAILDGLHQRYIEDTNPDTRAFHEAFADIVALFQHFTFADVLKHQIAITRGNLAEQNLLGQLAEQFGKAIGNYSALRDAIGFTNTEGVWMPHKPDPNEYASATEFHDRGAILVAAVFDAFLTIYRQRVKKVLRVATGGSGILGEGDLHPDLVDMLAETAADTASRVLRICVRALDYCPPADINFGDYLRAIITADLDMVKEDDKNYRIAFIEAFQKRGIFPSGLKTMSVETLIYEPYPRFNTVHGNEELFVRFLRDFKEEISYEQDRRRIYDHTKKFISGEGTSKLGMHERINQKFLQTSEGNSFIQLVGLLFPGNKEACKEMGLSYSTQSETASFSVENLWLASRITPDDKIVNHVILTLMQRRGIIGDLDENNTFSVKGYFDPSTPATDGGFIFRGGATLIFDLDRMLLKYVIKKDITSQARMEQQFRWAVGRPGAGTSAYFSDRTLAALSGPFSFMHNFNHIH